MQINNVINGLNWKKIAVIALVIFAGSWMLREVMFWSYLHEFQQTLNRFNTQFEQDQQTIHNKIIESENDADKWNKNFEQKQNEFHNTVDKSMKDTLEFLQNSREQMAARENQLDQNFAKLPDKMWQEHQEFARKARETFHENSKRMDAAFAKQLKQDEKNNTAGLVISKDKEAENRQNWEEARIRYHEKTGKWLPPYESVFNNEKL